MNPDAMVKTFRVYSTIIDDRPAVCRSCGAPLTYYETLKGKAMPVNAGAVPVRTYDDTDTGAAPRRVLVFAADDSHFASCPDAKDWSRQTKKPEEPNPAA